MAITKDTHELASAPDNDHSVALKLLADVHGELEKQNTLRKSEDWIDKAVDLFFDPLSDNQARLSGMAKRLDLAAKNGDFSIIAAQKESIEKELARDNKDLDRKATLGYVVGDVMAALPMLSISGLVAGGGAAIDHLISGKKAEDSGGLRAAPPEKITAPGDYTESINVDGKMRSYKVHVPPAYTGKPMPSVVMLHGISEDASSFAELTRMDAKADKEGFITIYPEGNPILSNTSHLAWNVPNWDIFHPARHADDVKFVGEVIDRVNQQLAIDPNRTYVAGFSNGGMLAQEVAAKNSDKVAAVALVGTALSGKDKAPANPVSVLDIHGTSDPVVPYQNWDNSLRLVKMQPVSYTSQYWKEADGISSSGETIVNGNLVTSDSVNKKTGVEVRQIGVVGGMHAWPGAHGVDLADQSLDATDEIWNFFSHHKRASMPVPLDNRIETA